MIRASRRVADASWRGDLGSAARVFVDQLGWPVTIDAERRQLMLRVGDSVDVLVLPGELASTAAVELRLPGMNAPVSASPDSRWWAFYTALARRRSPEVPTDLRGARVHAIPRGGQHIVPPAGCEDLWPRPPRPGVRLVAWATVITAARTALRQQTSAD